MDIKSLKERKKALKLTTYDLAIRADLPVSTVSKIMTGETKNPSYTTIERIDAVLYQEELDVRLNAYIKALQEYVQNTPYEEVNQDKFEAEYRKKHNLSDDPIPFAVPKDSKAFIENALAPKRDMRVSYKDIMKFEENRPIELLFGNVIYSEGPTYQHQLVVQNVGRILDNYIHSNHGKCKMFNVGINVFLCEDEYTLVCPDIVVNCEESLITELGINGAPDFVAEVTSPSTHGRDCKEKMHAYLRYGVREYWIIDLQKKRVVTYVNGDPLMTAIYSFDDEIPVSIYDGALTIRIADCLQ